MSEKIKWEKALFLQRFVAFIIDVLLISFLASLISAPFVDNDKVSKIQKEVTTVMNDFSSEEISIQDYATQTISLNYKMVKATGITTLISIFLSVCYFVVYQIHTGGQTIGKKIMKIKVISEDGYLSYNQMIFRSFIADSILVDLLCFIAMMIFNGMNYFYISTAFQAIQFVIMIISVIMICVTENGYAVHDRISHTSVIREK